MQQNTPAMKNIMAELRQLKKKPLEDIEVLASEDITTVMAIIKGPKDTPYEGGEFKVKLKLGSDFPKSPPKGFFVTKIWHPNVSPAGEICVNTLKKDWKETHGLDHILVVRKTPFPPKLHILKCRVLKKLCQTIKCLLIVPNAESALNEEAGMLLLENYEAYCKRAKMMTQIHAKPEKPEEEEVEKNENTNTQENNIQESDSKATKKTSSGTINKTATKKPAAANKKKTSLKRL